jgi:hypothetical protein
LRKHNNRIRLNGVLNQYCVPVIVLDSMLLDLVMKIVLQHNPFKSGHRSIALAFPLCAKRGHLGILNSWHLALAC